MEEIKNKPGVMMANQQVIAFIPGDTIVFISGKNQDDQENNKYEKLPMALEFFNHLFFKSKSNQIIPRIEIDY